MYLLNESLDNYVAQRARELAGARRDVAFAVRHFFAAQVMLRWFSPSLAICHMDCSRSLSHG
ncbi:hypothetical protein [Variovorax paradoxus]|uniref:hypothetical protein n=1 Tax=Variovorax paradoxus TaxID=34073 RepID=UPI001933487A|nr:hypothetical protein INQ48_34105 [Variovorax paradoxus]